MTPRTVTVTAILLNAALALANIASIPWRVSLGLSILPAIALAIVHAGVATACYLVLFAGETRR